VDCSKKKIHIDWAAAAVRTANLKGNRSVSNVGKGSAGNKSAFTEGDDISEGIALVGQPMNHKLPTQSRPINSSVHVILSAEIAKVEELLLLKQDLWRYAKARAKQLDDKRAELAHKAMGAKFTMEDRKKTAAKASSSVQVVEKSCQREIDEELIVLEQVCTFLPFTTHECYIFCIS
jgi:hypothetical protein